MCAYVWETDISGSYTGSKTRFVNYLLERIDFHQKKIRSILKNQKLNMEEVTEILHDEKIINTLVSLLSKPENLYLYEDIENIVEDFQNDEVDIRTYRKNIANFNCEFHWFLLDTINWTGSETFCRNIFGKKI